MVKLQGELNAYFYLLVAVIGILLAIGAACLSALAIRMVDLSTFPINRHHL